MSTKVIQHVVLTCDGPKCATNSGNKKPVTVEFDDEQVRDDANAMPDAFFRFIKVQPSPEKDKIVEFCGRKCLTDYLVYEYIAPLSPRELALQTANNAAVEMKKKPPSRFDGPVSQADGHSEAA